MAVQTCNGPLKVLNEPLRILGESSWNSAKTSAKSSELHRFALDLPLHLVEPFLGARRRPRRR